ncbi:MAG: radical SAM protein, partial [Planctomycetaceae bacterium]|nr:radical SAM protein [Planctomycetaceae bacterium]
MNPLMVNPRLVFDRRRPMDFVIDVVGNCNLRCPSCPVGNMGAINPNGLLDVELFKKLMAKGAKDYNISHVELYNWAEPFLHPELPKLIQIVKSYDLPCWLSSNLNVIRNVEEALRANPDFLRISLSGFTQPVYEEGHAKGNVERVKANMRLLSEARRKVGNCTTNIQVFYHKYKYNLHEVEPMR